MNRSSKGSEAHGKRQPRAASTRARGGRWLGLATLAVVFALAPHARAWNAHGHMLVALLAYDALSEARRAELAELLRAHPRYAQDLLPALPAELVTDAERARWLFAFASTWPDIVSKQPEYGRGTWHYVNLPLTLRTEAGRAQGELGVGCREARRRLPESRQRVLALDAERRARGEPGIPAGDSILEALPNNQRTLADRAAPVAQRGLALSWVLHLVGDAHQPLHGVALFTPRRFVSGDRGGNDISILVSGAEPRPLHRVWDDLLGAETSPAALDAGLALLRREQPAPRAAAIQLSDVNTWVDEDCELARKAVYTPAILRTVARFDSAYAAAPSTPPAPASGTSSGPDKPQLSLRQAYFTHAAQQARQRVRLAGARLAAWLEAAW